MKDIKKTINGILAEWDPINVGEKLAIHEYKRYVQQILEHSGSQQQLITYLKDILTHQMGIEYDQSNKKHCDDLQYVCDKIIHIFRV